MKGPGWLTALTRACGTRPGERSHEAPHGAGDPLTVSTVSTVSGCPLFCSAGREHMSSRWKTLFEKSSTSHLGKVFEDNERDFGQADTVDTVDTVPVLLTQRH